MIKLKIFFVSILLCFAGVLHAQGTKKIDSLLTIVGTSDAYSKYSDKELLKICNEAYNLSKKQKYDKGILNSIQKILAIKVNTNDTENFENLLSEGIALSEKLKNVSVETRLLMIKSWYFSKLGFYEKAKTALQNALNLNETNSNAEERIYRNSRIYSYYTSLMEESKAPADSILYYGIKSYKAALEIPKNHPEKQHELAEKEIALAGIYIDRGDLENGEKFLKEFNNSLVTKSDPFFNVQYLKLSGNLEAKRKNYEGAVKFYQNAAVLAKKSDVAQLTELYPLLAENYLQLKDYKNSSLYSQKFKKISDSLEAVKMKSYNNISKLEPKKEQTVREFWLPISFLLGVVAVSAYFFFRRNKNSTGELSDHLTENNQENERKVNAEELHELVKLAKTDEQAFYLKFEEVFPNLKEDLSPYNLTDLDQKFCCYLRMKFDTKQIALFTNSSLKSVESRKYRLRKKLNLSADEDLYSFIEKKGK